MNTNSLYVYGFSYANIDEANTLKKTNRDLRKASFEMILGFQALMGLEPVIKKIQKNFSQSDVSFVCGTSHGSLYATKDFLEEFSKTKRARPFLFQNSLHNSITGFLCQQFQLKGPSFTISFGDQTGESVLEVAQDLLQSGMSKVCLVVGVDGLVEAFCDTLQSYIKGATLTEGAGALLLSKEPINTLELCATMTIELSHTHAHAHADSGSDSHADDRSRGISSYYDSDLIDLIAQNIQQKKTSFLRVQPVSKKASSINLSYTVS